MKPIVDVAGHTLELKRTSKLSDKHFELVADQHEVVGELERPSSWRRRTNASAADGAWVFKPAGAFSRGVVATTTGATGESEVARYRPQRRNEDAIELGGGWALHWRRDGTFKNQWTLLDGQRELAHFRRHGWRDRVEVRLEPAAAQVADLALAVLLACQVIVFERERQSTAAASGAASAGAASS